MHTKFIQTLALLFFTFFMGLVSAGTITGKVVGVADGDTITVLDASNTQFKIRLEGIDAPEKAQAFGQRSKEHLSDLVFGKQVEVQTGKTDNWGRTIGKVLVNGKDANLEQIRAGMAWHYKHYKKEQSASDRTLYVSAEAVAQASKTGLWRDANPTPPWDWRHSGKIGSDSPSSDFAGCLCGGQTFCKSSRGGQFCVGQDGRKNYRSDETVQLLQDMIIFSTHNDRAE